MNVFDFTESSPPTDPQFEAIAEWLLVRLQDRMGVTFEATATHVEPRSWVTMKIRSRPVHERLMNITFIGIISFSFRDAAPLIDSVLLPFSKGKRLTVGSNSILVANYVDDRTGGEWEDFRWDDDIYGEWECDDLPDR